MQVATQEAVGAIKGIGGTITRISEIAAAIAAAVEEQGAVTQEISRNVQQAARGTTQVASNITDVNRGASETGAASAQVLASAQSLSRREQAAQGRGRQIPHDGAGGVTSIRSRSSSAGVAPRSCAMVYPIILTTSVVVAPAPSAWQELMRNGLLVS